MPGLAVVLVGTRGDSETYVRSKRKACEEVGIQSFATDLPEDVKEDELLEVGPAWTCPPNKRQHVAQAEPAGTCAVAELLLQAPATALGRRSDPVPALRWSLGTMPTPTSTASWSSCPYQAM